MSYKVTLFLPNPNYVEKKVYEKCSTIHQEAIGISFNTSDGRIVTSLPYLIEPEV